MTLFGPLHLTILALTVLIPMLLALVVRSWPVVSHGVRGAFLLTLAGSKLTTLGFALHGGYLTWQNGLPMHLCDWALICCIISLISRQQLFFELAYFWGLSGTFQAMLTPDLGWDFPDPRFFTFFLGHGGIIATVLYLAWGEKMKPGPFSILRALAYTQLYLAVSLSVNYLLDANYGYLCAKPLKASLLDHMGPWPWYILALEGICVVFFVLFYSPVWGWNLITGSSSKQAPEESSRH